MYSDERIYQIALTLIDGVGDVNAKNLLAYCGSASEVFKQKKSTLLKVPGIGEYTAKSVVASKDVFLRAEKEIKFIEKHKISLLFFTNSDYPNRLKYCSDGPILLYYKGNANLNASKIISVVGSRKPSDYGKHITESFISELEQNEILIVSGLAYGVDVSAHKASLNANLQTVGVLAHGLDRIYPQQHASIAKKMIGHGGLLTDFISETNPDAVNFPKRNRIVAGLCDALVVVESKRKGGSLITATIANSYNKDVFAFPGRANDELSEGCNGLIKQNRATLIESAADLLFAMQWEESISTKIKSAQVPLPINLTEEEQLIATAFKTKNPLQIDELCYLSNMSVSKVASLLLQLEFNNLIKSKPGKLYEFTGGNV
ncbi:MAG: DNA-processing protein DprA [Bacteroidota bacterium]|nr:DNA-processing protein DprA [Bacteroidota bacterium]